MAPQISIPPAANVLGTIGTVLWCIQSLPQVWHSYRTKNVDGLPALMVFLWSSSGVPFGVYAVCQNLNIPLQIQPQCYSFLLMISWGQCMYYGRKWKAWQAVLACGILMAVFAGLETTLILVTRGPYWNHGVEWPVTTIGSIAIVMMLSGFIPIPFELIKRRGRVVGVDFLFLLMDSSGALFSLLSLAVQHTFDAQFGTLYILCMVFEYSIFLSHGIWLWRTRALRRRAREAQTAYDDFPEAIAWQSQAFHFDWNKLRSTRPSERESSCSEVHESVDTKV